MSDTEPTPPVVRLKRPLSIRRAFLAGYALGLASSVMILVSMTVVIHAIGGWSMTMRAFVAPAVGWVIIGGVTYAPLLGLLSVSRRLGAAWMWTCVPTLIAALAMTTWFAAGAGSGVMWGAGVAGAYVGGIVMLLSAVACVVFGPKADRAHRGVPEGCCTSCGYDLRGLARDQPCPECGADRAS